MYAIFRLMASKANLADYCGPLLLVGAYHQFQLPIIEAGSALGTIGENSHLDISLLILKRDM